MRSNYLATTLMAVSFIGLQGCLTATRGVSESNKDTTGTYDGRWVAVGKRTAPIQKGIGN